MNTGESESAEDVQWDIDPAEWPHTPPLDAWRRLYEDDDNLVWRADIGHVVNALDAAFDRIDEISAERDDWQSQVVPIRIQQVAALREAEAATSEIRRLNEVCDDWAKKYESWRDACLAAESKVARAEAVLDGRMSGHHDQCHSWRRGFMCNCWRADLRAALGIETEEEADRRG